jgi:hypothetical protein
MSAPRFDQAHAAARHDRQAGVPAIIRNFDAGPSSRLNAIQALILANFDFLTVNKNNSHLRRNLPFRRRID